MSSAGGWISFSEIKSRVTIEQVLRSYRVDWLRRSGDQQYRGRCPVHQGEGEEAFHANFRRNIFHCFACGAGGNVLDLLAALEGCSIREAALRLRGGQVSGSAAASRPAERQLVTKKRITHNSPRFSAQARSVCATEKVRSKILPERFLVRYNKLSRMRFQLAGFEVSPTGRFCGVPRGFARRHSVIETD